MAESEPKTATTKLQGSKQRTAGREYMKYYVRLPSKWIKELGLEKGSPLELELWTEETSGTGGVITVDKDDFVILISKAPPET